MGMNEWKIMMVLQDLIRYGPMGFRWLCYRVFGVFMSELEAIKCIIPYKFFIV